MGGIAFIHPKPSFVQPGEWAWRSYTAGPLAGRTVLVVMTKGGGLQHLIELDWSDFDGVPMNGRTDAEDLLQFICDKINHKQRQR